MESDPIRICQILVGLPDVAVLGVDDPPGGLPLTVHVESTAGPARCPRCGGPGWVKDRPVVVLTDLPAFGRPVRLAWHKVRRTCPDTGCPQGSWTCADDRIAASRCTVTHRTGRWMTEQVGRARRAVARELGCDWHTVNDAVVAYGALRTKAGHNVQWPDQVARARAEAASIRPDAALPPRQGPTFPVTTVTVANTTALSAAGSLHRQGRRPWC